MRKSVALLLSLSAVSACGGSGDSGEQSVSIGEQSVSIDASAIRIFSDDSGVARYSGSSSEGSVTGYIITPELALVIPELEANDEVEPADPDALTIVAFGPNTTLRQGTLTVDGSVLNVFAAITTDEDAGLFLIESTDLGFSFLQTAGDLATNLPTGTVSYSGVLGLQDLVFDPDLETGTFTASATFDGTPDIFLSGVTDSYTVSGTAVISGDSFSSGSMLISGAGFTQSSSMNGDFHGEGANSVAGVIYSNDDAGDFRGGFVGSQD